MTINNKFDVGQDTFELNVDPKNAILVERHFSKYTKLDKEIQNKAIPKKPFWLNLIIRLLRFYQKNISHKLGNRCVFDPSCSHYSEEAFREFGFLKGTLLTIKRLKKCKPENGGIDELKTK
ncbi:membrane protein insertion efficiency factor YidD [Mucilaginibacter arboris]|uniref:Membrane protein insertion efficiency factor YidD n=1 Tax=Mucilaginibacter arboris TaxID=2682090 RepID=A0A7K1T1N0_9SPHI|nr:membrane protein insertion efficiency factor YidD [Mucilaginibacter arboris]MVN23493.1 membrane protein insertion efficiency factor YidD [Mucilaginibacter arboris]